MFVAKWSPGLQQEKPELTMVPVWLEFTGVPLQFFNREGLQEIAGLVGQPVCLHPSIENLTNIEVGKVYTIIDPRKPLPEGVNTRFENGETRRIKVSSPWLPSLCSYCKKVGHTISHCTAAPVTCTICKSVKHKTENCPRINKEKILGKAPIVSLLPIVPQPKAVYKPIPQPRKMYKPVDIGSKPDIASISRHPLAQPISRSCPTPAKSVENIPADVVNKLASHPALPQEPSLANAHNLIEGGLCVDTGLKTSPSHSSSSRQSSDSDPGNYSDEEDNPDDEKDKFIEVISNRLRKRSIATVRARGPLKL